MKYILSALLLMTSFVLRADVRDGAGFFSPSAVSQGDSEIDRIKNNSRLNVTVETFNSIPEEKRSAYASMNKDEFFQSWLRERARATNTDGLFILICRNPSHLQVGMGQAAVRSGFTITDRDQIRDILVSSFKRGDFDRGLKDALAQTSQRFAQLNASPSRPYATGDQPISTGYSKPVAEVPSAPHKSFLVSFFTWIIILGLIFLVIAFFVIRAIYRWVRHMTSRVAPAGPAPGPGPGSSGPSGGGGADF